MIDDIQMWPTTFSSLSEVYHISRIMQMDICASTVQIFLFYFASFAHGYVGNVEICWRYLTD